MHTPAHIAASLFVWRKQESAKHVLALLLGAITPDAPMFLFFIVVRAAGRTGQEIWDDLYFHAGWQLFFDIFNSAPLFLLIAAMAWRLNSTWWLLFAGSGLLHIACDFPLHHDDAHRHFLPLSDFRLASPVSYWDPRHYGIPVAVAEAALTVAVSVYLLCKSTSRVVRTVSVLILSLYALACCLLVAWLTRG